MSAPTFKINDVLKTETVEGLPNFVVEVTWACVYSNGGCVGELSHKQSFSYSSSEGFTPFNQLTEQQVLGWVIDALGPDAVAFYQNTLKEQVDKAVAESENPPRKMFVTAFYNPEQTKAAPWAA